MTYEMCWSNLEISLQLCIFVNHNLSEIPQELEIRAVLLDEIMQNPEHPTAEHLLDLEVKSLRDTHNLLEKVGIAEATAFIEENPHPRLW